MKKLIASDDKVKALVEYLDISADEIKEVDEGYIDKCYETPKGTYRVLTDEESEKALREAVISDLDNYGFEIFGDLLENFIDYGCLDEYEMRSYAENEQDFIVNETLSDEEIVEQAIDFSIIDEEEVFEKLVDFGIIDEDETDSNIYEYTNEIANNIEDLTGYDMDDLKNELIDSLTEDITNAYSTYGEWYYSEFGEQGLSELYERDNDIVDFDEVVNWCLTLNDYGNWLAQVDGKTMELNNGYFAYRIE